MRVIEYSDMQQDQNLSKLTGILTFLPVNISRLVIKHGIQTRTTDVNAHAKY